MSAHYERIKDTEMPYVVHEWGKHNVFPEISKYTGIYKAKNVQVAHERERAGRKGVRIYDGI